MKYYVLQVRKQAQRGEQLPHSHTPGEWQKQDVRLANLGASSWVLAWEWLWGRRAGAREMLILGCRKSCVRSQETLA